MPTASRAASYPLRTATMGVELAEEVGSASTAATSTHGEPLAG